MITLQGMKHMINTLVARCMRYCAAHPIMLLARSARRDAPRRAAKN